MGDLNVTMADSSAESQRFTKQMLADVQALEYMLENNWFEDDIVRIGAEQEMCIIDNLGKPAHMNMELLDRINDKDIVHELAKFNIELNLAPQTFTGNCLSAVEHEILEKMKLVRKHCDDMGIHPILTGILPTIRKSDVDHSNVTPLERYGLLMDVLNNLRGDLVELNISGVDELIVKHESALLEACNTSFQVHLQIKPQEFVSKYNQAQVLAAPVMAVAVNSPLLFGKRLWHETRIALFQQSVDTRKSVEHLREKSPRVMFGNDWLRKSIIELYKEDIIRFRVILNTDVDEDVNELLEKGITPKLRALNVHNGTVYRWNRPCYGISPNGKPHLRIENRILPAGPTVLDEMANAAFWLGLMNSFDDYSADVTKDFEYDSMRRNFFLASQNGLDSIFEWKQNKRISASELIEKELLPLAKEGLGKANVAPADISRYLDVIEARVKKGVTGSSWMLKSYNKMVKKAPKDEAITALTAAIVYKQRENIPVHLWADAEIMDSKDWSPAVMKVEEFMTTDVHTCQKEDILDLVADILDWKKIRYMPVEDAKGELVGLMTSRILLRHYKKENNLANKKPQTVESLMVKNIITIAPQDSILKAIELMEENTIGCLPVVEKGKLVGVVTEMDFLKLSASIMRRQLST